MSVFILKILALGSMIVDHTGFFLGNSSLVSSDIYNLMRAVGRIAFPIYAFLLVNGFQKTSNRQRYLSRLILFAVLSQIPFTMTFSLINYGYGSPSDFSFYFTYDALPYLAFSLCAVTAYILLVKADISAIYLVLFFFVGGAELHVSQVQILGGGLNVFYTLSLALAAMAVLDNIIHSDVPLAKTLVCAAFLVVSIVLLQPNADYGYMGIFLMLALYVCRRWRVAQLLVIAVWCYLEYWGSGVNLMFCFSLISLLPIMLYNGKKGPAMKLGFYALYPLHLLALGVINILI